MKILSFRKMYLPAISILAGVGLLLALLGVSTYRNLDRQRAAALESLNRQGTALLQALEAGARTGMMMPMWSEDAVGNLIREISRNEAIGYVYILEPDGRIPHRAGAIKPAAVNLPAPASITAGEILETIRSLPDGSHYYELAKRFEPYAFPPDSMMHRGPMMGAYGSESDHSHEGDLVVIGLKLAPFFQARRADIQHALLMVGVLLLLGSAALFFIIIIQNYYLVDKTLNQTKSYTRQVLASMANGLIGIDLKGRITSYNLKALELLGLKEESFQETDLNTLIDFKAYGVEATLNQCREVLERELFYRKPSGEEIPLSFSSTPILDETGACQGAVLVLRDLTELKRLETKLRRAEKLATAGQLAAGVAHEIRNPLSSVRGFAQFLKHSLKDRPQEQDCAATIVEEVDRINGVVSDLLSLARPVETMPVECSIPEVVRHVERLVALDARSGDIHLKIDIADGIEHCRVDPNQVTQALLNLVLNALHAAEPGGTVHVGAATAETGELRLWVSDNGHGIRPEHMDKIFDPFFTTRSHGTGLGLAIVQQIVESHNGEITVESAQAPDQRGCKFTIRIPSVCAGGPALCASRD
jgi:two-component system sensor histidine kinase HydH